MGWLVVIKHRFHPREVFRFDGKPIEKDGTSLTDPAKKEQDLNKDYVHFIIAVIVSLILTIIPTGLTIHQKSLRHTTFNSLPMQSVIVPTAYAISEHKNL